MTKYPKYLVPAMSDIAQQRANGLRVASLFAGCGGSSLGYRMAGCKVVYANEFIDRAAQTYLANARSGTVLDRSDIRDVSGEVILKAADGCLDILDGSPPCASFSSSGVTSKNWGTQSHYSGKMQRTDDLFIEYVRILRATKPRAFVAENVTGLVRGVSKGYFKIIYRELEESGYNVQARVLDASYLGVPQARQRVIFIGTRSDLSIAPVFPKPLPYRYSLQDAIADLESPWAKDGYAYDAETKQRIDLRDTALGKEWPAAARDQPHRFFNLSVAKKHLPIPTLVAKAGGRGTASVTHYEPRKFTLAEGRRLCGFPDDFALVGTYAERMERLGRAVPPVMMSKIAATLVKILTI